MRPLFAARRRSRLRLGLLTSLVLGAPVQAAQAQVFCDVSWAAAVSGNWDDPTRWSPGAVPTSTESVCIEAVGAAYTVTLNVDAEAGGLKLNSADATLSFGPGNSLLVAGASRAVDLDAGTLGTRGSDFQVSDGAVFNYNGGSIDGQVRIKDAALNIGATGGGAFVINGSSTLSGNIAPGQQVIVASILTDATLTAASGFTNGGIISLRGNAAGTSANLTVTAGTLTNTGAITAQVLATISADLTNDGTVEVAGALQPTTLTLAKQNGIYTNNGTFIIEAAALTMEGTTFENVAGGVIEGTGTLDVSAVAFTSAGDINPGGSAGTLTIVGDLVLTATSDINTEIGGPTATESDLIQVIGNLTLGGSLNVSLIGGFHPSAGDAFVPLTYNSVTGRFDAVSLPALGGGLDWALAVDLSGLLLSVGENPLAVNSTGDTGDANPGDGACETAVGNGLCTLRAAIQESNADPAFGRITFAIPGAGPHIIQPTSPLPIVTASVVIDGYTQAGAGPNTNPPGSGTNAVLMIELDGGMAGADVSGLEITASNVTIRGLVINRFAGDGIHIRGAAAENNVIAGNFVGTDVTGTADLGNAVHGVEISGGASNSTVGGTVSEARNVISGNDDGGVGIAGSGTAGNVVQGNLIGTDVTGTAALGNTLTGIFVADGATDNVVGGAEAAAGNVISDNGAAGVVLDGPGTTGNVVAGNFIGTDIDGTNALPNTTAGVWIVDGAADNTIGGTTLGARNIISGNDGSGISILVEEPGLVPSGNRIHGNFIGIDVTGQVALGNATSGVVITDAGGNTIGGTPDGARNIISGNQQDGIAIAGADATGNVVQGNSIGTDASGTAALGNVRRGVFISNAPNNTVGGTEPGAGNVIAHNNRAGVGILGAFGNGILSNQIHDNASLGIDLAPGGVTPNDPGDADAGANELQNFPFLNRFGQLPRTISGTLNSTPNTPFTLQFYSNPVCDASNHGEGQTLLETHP